VGNAIKISVGWLERPTGGSERGAVVVGTFGADDGGGRRDGPVRKRGEMIML